jgi:hypothetical protein
MSLPARPNPAQLPTLTEVIDLLPPTPVGDGGMHSAPRSAAPAPGSPGSAPIVTGGLASSQAPSNWTPMTTVVVPTLHEVAMPPAAKAVRPAFDLPVLESVVPELDLAVTPVASSHAIDVVPAAVVVPVAAPAPMHEPAPPVPPQAQALPDLTEAQLAQRVLSVVQKQIDSMIDFRLKEAMAPILARHSEALVRDLREELSRTMADVVARSVAQEMAKLRQR